MKVLILGAAGRVGTRLTRTLTPSHDLILADVRPIEDPRYLKLDVLNIPLLEDTVAQVDAVVYLSIVDLPAYGGIQTPQYVSDSFRVQVEGVYNVLQAAVHAGRKRVLHASTVSAVSRYPRDVFVTSEHRYFTAGTYGITKGLGEELCRNAHETQHLPVVILRLGNVYVPELHGHPQQAHPHPSRVHVDEVALAFSKVLEHPEPSYALIHVVGEHPDRVWDLTAARDLYGWSPTVRFGPDGQPLT
jgi:uronate dehydrogenase